MNIFMVKQGSDKIICTAFNREDAKLKAFKIIGGNSDLYIVYPLTNEGDRIHLSITVSV